MARTGENQFPLVDAANIVVPAASGNIFPVTIANNRTVSAPTNPVIWQKITFIVTQDGVGGRTLAWNAIYRHAWSDAGNTANKTSTISFVYNGVNWVQDGAQSPYYA